MRSVRGSVHCLSLVGLLFLFAHAPAARGAIVTYLLLGKATGSASGAAFSDADFSIAAAVESSEVVQDRNAAEQGYIVYETPFATGVVAVEGVGFGVFTYPLSLIVNQNDERVELRSGRVLIELHAATFASYDLRTPLAAIAPTLVSVGTAFEDVPVSIGSVDRLSFTSVADVTFQAIPEPAASALAAVLGLVALAARSGRGPSRGREQPLFGRESKDPREVVQHVRVCDRDRCQSGAELEARRAAT